MELLEKPLAALVVNSVQRNGKLSYDEALELYNYNAELLMHLDVADIAFRKIFEDAVLFIEYLTALNILEELGRSEHLEEAKCMILFRNGEVKEYTDTIPRFTVTRCSGSSQDHRRIVHLKRWLVPREDVMRNGGILEIVLQ